jgi:hypothetical protein
MFNQKLKNVINSTRLWLESLILFSFIGFIGWVIIQIYKYFI